jgi:hypothetical protein
MRPIPLPAKAVNGLSWAMPVPPRDPKGHRTGYTTGACAAAAAKAAARCLLRDAVLQEIETALPNKRRVRFRVPQGRGALRPPCGRGIGGRGLPRGFRRRSARALPGGGFMNDMRVVFYSP